MGEIDEVVKLVLPERVQQHVAERVVDALVRWAESGEKYRDEIIDDLIPQAMKECVEGVKLVPQDEAQNRVQEQMVAIPQIREESVVLSNADRSTVDSLDPGHELSKKLHEVGVYDEVHMVEHGYRQRRLGEAHGVKGEMSVEVIRFVPREQISYDVNELIVYLNGWITVIGGIAEYSKRAIVSGVLGSAEAPKIEVCMVTKTVRDAEKYRDGGEANNAKIRDEGTVENCCVAVENVKTGSIDVSKGVFES